MLARVKYADYDRGIDVEALSDGYAYDEYSCLYLLSVAGRESNVKAVTSAVVSGRTVQIMSKTAVEVGGGYGRHYRILSTRLPDSLLHQVLADEGFFRTADRPGNLLYADGEDPAPLVYEAVRAGHPVPLIPEWSKWLYERLRQEGHVEELQGNRKVLRVSVDEAALDSLVSEGVKNGEIRFW